MIAISYESFSAFGPIIPVSARTSRIFTLIRQKIYEPTSILRPDLGLARPIGLIQGRSSLLEPAVCGFQAQNVLDTTNRNMTIESEYEMKLACTSRITNVQANTKGETMGQHVSTPVKDQIENLKKIRATKAIRHIHGLIARNEKHNYETTWSDGDDLNSIAEDFSTDKYLHANNLPFRKKDFPEKWDLFGHMNSDKPFRVKRISKRLCLWEANFREFLREIEKPKSKDEITPEQRALCWLSKHPEWTDKKIADKIGVNRTSVYRWPIYCKARKRLKEEGKKSLPKGFKKQDGNIEACE